MIWILIAIAVGAFTAEKLWPAGQLPKVRGWWARVALVNVCQLGIVLLAGQTWDQWLNRTSLFSLSKHLPDIPCALIAYALSCVIYYWWHRLRHESTWFWRLCHQLHHSPRRIEVVTSFYKHPFEIIVNSILSSLIVYALLGCNPAAAAYYLLLITVSEYFYHWNITTPHWLGWIIQRPESHRVHHQYQKHSMNYADLPLIDWLFGTFKNPTHRIPRCGFNPRRETRFASMLACLDVHQPQANPGLAPTCFGCKKRWACQASRENGTQKTAS